MVVSQSDDTKRTENEHILGGTGMKQLVALVAAGLLAGAAWAAATASPAVAQTISLNPSSGTPGTRVAVSGSGFDCPRRAPVSVSLDDETVSTSALSTGTSFSAAFTVPDGTATGKHTVKASISRSSVESASPSTFGLKIGAQPTGSGPPDTVVCDYATAPFTVSQPPPTPPPGGSSAGSPASSTTAHSQDGEGFPLGVVVGGAAAIAAMVVMALVALAFRRRRHEPAVAQPHATQLPRLRSIDDPGSQVVEPEPDRPLVVIRATLDPAEIASLDGGTNDDNRP
jgi:hypothetical protein